MLFYWLYIIVFLMVLLIPTASTFRIYKQDTFVSSENDVLDMC